jgi:hypothetical protein
MIYGIYWNVLEKKFYLVQPADVNMNVGCIYPRVLAGGGLQQQNILAIAIYDSGD